MKYYDCGTPVTLRLHLYPGYSLVRWDGLGTAAELDEQGTPGLSRRLDNESNPVTSERIQVAANGNGSVSAIVCHQELTITSPTGPTPAHFVFGDAGDPNTCVVAASAAQGNNTCGFEWNLDSMCAAAPIFLDTELG